MKLFLRLAAGLLLTASSCFAAETVGGDKAFSFVALGDMPYNVPDDYAKFERLIGVVNGMKPAFTIHVGDIKSGSLPCTDDNFKKVFDEFQMFDGALVYTPGDNEWTDCHREKAGKFDPLERLAKVREMFYPDKAKSLGKAPIAVESQATVMPDRFGKFVENARFEKNGVVFATVHVVGSNNNFEAQDAKTAMEYFERDPANVAWLADTFDKAARDGAKAVVIAMQANLWEIRQAYPSVPRASAFVNTLDAIEKGAKSFGKPVLVIQGDAHELEVTGFRGTDNNFVPNVLRLQVMGETRVHAVRVVVDPDSPGVFGFMPVYVPENGALN